MWFRTYDKKILNGIMLLLQLSYIYWLFILSFKLHHDQVSFRSYRRRFCLILNIYLSIYPQRQWIWSVHYPVCYYLSINFTKLLPLIPRRFVLFPTYSGDRAIKWSCACQLDIEIQNIISAVSNFRFKAAWILAK